MKIEKRKPKAKAKSAKSKHPGAGRGVSLSFVASELGVSWATVERKLAAAGIDPKSSGLRWRDVFRAFIGDKAASLARKALADAEMAEHEVRLATREVVNLEEAEKWVRDSFSPVREWANAMPAKLASRVNPTDPKHAMIHLDEWVEQFLRHVRERVGQEDEKEEAPKKPTTK